MKTARDFATDILNIYNDDIARKFLNKFKSAETEITLDFALQTLQEVLDEESTPILPNFGATNSRCPPGSVLFSD